MKIRSKIKELIFKPMIDSIDDMDKYEEKEITKKRMFYDWFFNYILEPIKNSGWW